MKLNGGHLFYAIIFIMIVVGIIPHFFHEHPTTYHKTSVGLMETGYKHCFHGVMYWNDDSGLIVQPDGKPVQCYGKIRLTETQYKEFNGE